MLEFKFNGQATYKIMNVDHIPTPRLIMFEDRVRRNIDRIRSYLEAVVPDSGYRHLFPHIKTHKSSTITKMLMNAGVSSFKTSLNEAELAAECGAKEVFLAYPLLRHDSERLACVISKFTNTAFFIQIGSIEHAEILKQVTNEKGTGWKYFIDLDVGMHRTGIRPDEAFDLYMKLSGMEGFEFIGLHGYDGHIHHADAQERKKESQKSMTILMDVFDDFGKKGVTVPRVITSGSISFREDLSILNERIGRKTFLQVSPGNWIYWDSGYDSIIPGQFEIAATILSQVIDVYGNNQITLNLGHKRWGADRGPVERFSPHGLRVLKYNEEHTILESKTDRRFRIGDYVLIIPKHSCSTVNLYEHFTIIGENGEIKEFDSPVDGRNR